MYQPTKDYRRAGHLTNLSEHLLNEMKVKGWDADYLRSFKFGLRAFESSSIIRSFDNALLTFRDRPPSCLFPHLKRINVYVRAICDAQRAEALLHETVDCRNPHQLKAIRLFLAT